MGTGGGIDGDRSLVEGLSQACDRIVSLQPRPLCIGELFLFAGQSEVHPRPLPEG